MADPYRYIFGYGSLIETKSRTSTAPSAVYASPVVVHGVQRGWFDRVETPGYAPTYLGAVESEGAICNGVIYPVTQEAWNAYVERESGYDPKPVTGKIDMLDGSAGPPSQPVYYFASKTSHPAEASFPIVQSYVDVCLTGCMQLEGAYPLAQKIKIDDKTTMSFSELFIHSTNMWSFYWENDRLLPRRPFVYQPNAYAIDTILNKAPNTREIYPNIQLAPASWRRP